MKLIRTVYSDAYYCETRQPSMRKLPLVARLAEEHGYAELIAPAPVGRKELEKVHQRCYVESIMTGQGELAESAFGFWSESYRDGVLAINGGNLLAAKMALEDGIAANVGQGFHHAPAAQGNIPFRGEANSCRLITGIKFIQNYCHGGNLLLIYLGSRRIHQ